MTPADLMTEDMLHIYTADLLRAFAAPGVVWWHTPNQNKHKVQYRVKLKAMGVRAGVPDFTIIVPETEGNRRPIVSFLELKDAIGVQSDGQIKFERDVTRIGVSYVIARTPGQVDWTLTEWGAVIKPVSKVHLPHGAGMSGKPGADDARRSRPLSNSQSPRAGESGR